MSDTIKSGKLKQLRGEKSANDIVREMWTKGKKIDAYTILRAESTGKMSLSTAKLLSEHYGVPIAEII